MTRNEKYVKSLDHQIREWAKGNSTHNHEFNECCPDFSCCKSHLQAPEEVRQIYYNAYSKGDDKTTHRLLGEFLTRLVESEVPDKKIYITGLDRLREELN